MTDASNDALLDRLARIADALERLTPDPNPHLDLAGGSAFVWRSATRDAAPVPRAALPLSLMLGVDDQKATLVENTRRFAAGLPANDALLWGARGTGKSALIRAAHAAVAQTTPELKLLSLPRDALADTPSVVQAVGEQPHRVILLLDDLSFEADEGLAKMLKPALDGGAGARPNNLLVYATSNRRHLLARSIDENNPNDLRASETAEERIALSDRFGLWLGFHKQDQPDYLAIVHAYAKELKLPLKGEALERRALEWSMARGARSGRVARQFILDLAGESGVAFNLEDGES
ncbi:MAG: ATP-binding protein [Caulobacterales bacterium]